MSLDVHTLYNGNCLERDTIAPSSGPQLDRLAGTTYCDLAEAVGWRIAIIGVCPAYACVSIKQERQSRWRLTSLPLRKLRIGATTHTILWNEGYHFEAHLGAVGCQSAMRLPLSKLLWCCTRVSGNRGNKDDPIFLRSRTWHLGLQR